MTLLEMARTMDPEMPPTSVLELTRRYRWPGGYPPTEVSLLGLAKRHTAPTSDFSKVLAYNTFLLPEVNIPWDIPAVLSELGISIGEAIVACDIGAETVIAVMRTDVVSVALAEYGLAWLLDRLGVSDSEVADILSTGAEVAAAVFTFGLSEVVKDQSDLEILNDVLDHLVTGPLQFLMEVTGLSLEADIINWLVEYASWVLDELFKALELSLDSILEHLFGFSLSLNPLAKPALVERAPRIGQAMLAQHYDIMALSEVWDWNGSLGGVNAAREAVTKAFHDSGTPIHTPTAQQLPPKRPLALIDSGLYRITRERYPVVHYDSCTFTHEGLPLYDTDAFSSKGVFLTRIQCGQAGQIDFYNSHLLSGNDILTKLGEFLEGSPLDGISKEILTGKGGPVALQKRQMNQVKQLVQWVLDTRDERNVVVVGGDFNIGAHDHDGAFYTQLSQAMASIGLVDLFRYQYTHYQPTIGDEKSATHGHEEAGHKRFDELCAIDVTPGSGNFGYCNQAKPLSPNSQQAADRIDYLFVEQPTAKHTYLADFTRLRRNPFKADGLPEEQAYLSDHMGLDVGLLLSRKD